MDEGPVEGVMGHYKVSFFKTLVGGNGRPAKCLQQTIEIRKARSPERAIRAAEHRYARRRGVRNWQLYADACELEADQGRRHLPAGAAGH
jgi:hypothetical protein